MSEKFVTGKTIRTGQVSGRLYPGFGDGPNPGVLVLHGSGGARGYEQTYAALLAEHGYTVFCVEYFGAPGIRDALLEVPLEEFGDAADYLLDRPDIAGERVGVVGFSRGGEASLLVGSQFDTIGVVIAYVPSCYVWAAPSWMDGIGKDQPTWTLCGKPLPYLFIDEYLDEQDHADKPLGDDAPDATALALECSTAREKARAMIPVEDIHGPVLLISGGNDTVWPSAVLAERAVERLEEHGHPYRFEHRCFPNAGHTIRVPYQFGSDTAPDETHQYGGTHEANAKASACAWHTVLEFLGNSLR